MTTLHLGVIDLPYRHVGPGFRGRGKKRRAAKSIGSKTTFEVAEILEHRYHVMESFFEVYGERILEELMSSFQGGAETALMTGQVNLDPSQSAMDKVKLMFSRFLSEREVEKLGIAGVPTLAALHGVSHRFAHPYARRPRRPSFIDTGLYESSFRAWVD